MQGEGETEERKATGASRRDPPIIEGQAKEIGAAPATAPESVAPVDAAASVEAADAPTDAEAAPEQTAAPAPRRGRAGRLLALIGVPVLVIAGGAAWLAAPGARAPSDVRTKIIAMLPPAAQKALGVAPKAEAPVAATTADAKPTAADAAPPPMTPAATPSQSTDSQAPGVAQPPVAAREEQPAPTPQAAPPAATSNDTAAARNDDAKPAPVANATPAPSVTSAQRSEPPANVDFATLSERIDALNARLDALAGPSPAQAALAAKTEALATKLETLTARIGALEAKLTPPKSDQRAPESRENGEATGAQSTAARVVVAQNLAQALASGVPLEGAVSALRTLGVGDDKLADFSPYLKSGAPGLAQLSAQWTALRGKILGADRPVSDATWSDRLLGKLRGLVQINWAGKGDASAFGVFGSVEAALKRGDLAGAIKASDALRDGAKAATAEWRAAATQKLKAENAAQAILSDSMAAIARPKS